MPQTTTYKRLASAPYSSFSPDWEVCAFNTYRLRVPGGWLLQVYGGNPDEYPTAVCLVFVADADHGWTIIEEEASSDKTGPS